MRLYYEKDKNKVIIFKHFDEESIPYKGWLHYCFLCGSITSRNQNYLNSNKYYVIVCKDCKHKFHNNSYAVIKNFITKKKL